MMLNMPLACSHMYSMFYGCSTLTTLDVSHFDTTKVTDMRQMFINCNKLTSITVGKNFATANLPKAGPVTGWDDGGLFYVNTENKTNLEVKGDASDALKAYDFATDNRIVSFVSSASVASSVSLADPTDSTEDEVSEIDGNSVAKQSDSQVTDGEAEVDTDYSEVDSNASANTNSTDNGEGSNSTREPSLDDLYYSDSAAA